MIHRILFLLIFFFIGVLIAGWWHNHQHIVMTNQKQLEQLMHFGYHFTLEDGQDLCERVKTLETVSYGYRDAGHIPLKCDYVERKHK